MNIRKPKLWEALVPVLSMTIIIVIAILFWGLEPHIPIVLACIIASFMALRVGCTWEDILNAILESNFRALEALFIVMAVGMLIGSWMLAGVVPAMVYYGLQVITPSIFLATGAVLCAIVSVASGSSWTSSGTVGIALMGIAAGLGINPALAAGMVISGAYFGDKLSPLSDSTNVAAATAETPLYDHVASMLWTTLPSFILALIIYTIIGIGYGSQGYDLSRITLIQDTLSSLFNISPILLLPPIFVIVAAVLRIPALPSLLGVSFIGGLWAMIFQGASIGNVLESFHYGYFAETGVEIVDKLVNRGGLDSMMWTISLIMFALAFGGILEKARFTEVLIEPIIPKIKSVASLVAVTILTGIICDFVLTDQYIAIIIPGRIYAPLYDEMGLERNFLSRTLEDGGTLWSPMFPWNGCGAYQAATLGVPTFSYFPYAFFNLINPIVSIIMAYLGIGVLYKDKGEVKEAA
ncbi:MAG TPA: Na+/H+ antiporter NhaC [Thermoanaerobacterales bacterium]|nr:Na+/H+ antiporter NhaC [Thermoanaerobacterales bacterium]